MAIAEQLRQLQHAMRTASTPASAQQLWQTKDAQGSKLAQIIQSFDTQTRAMATADPSGASRQSAEFTAPLSSMAGCSAAFTPFRP